MHTEVRRKERDQTSLYYSATVGKELCIGWRGSADLALELPDVRCAASAVQGGSGFQTSRSLWKSKDIKTLNTLNGKQLCNSDSVVVSVTGAKGASQNLTQSVLDMLTADGEVDMANKTVAEGVLNESSSSTEVDGLPGKWVESDKASHQTNSKNTISEELRQSYVWCFLQKAAKAKAIKFHCRILISS